MNRHLDHVVSHSDPIAAYCRHIGLSEVQPDNAKAAAVGLSITWTVPKYHRESGRLLPRQGFKLHLSTHVHNALSIYTVALPYLLEQCIDFKALPNLEDIARINRGVYGLSQVGKIITIYPLNIRSAESIATDLARLLVGFTGPIVISDYPVSSDAPLYYRYGVIAPPPHETDATAQLLQAPDGAWQNDDRTGRTVIPSWVTDELALPTTTTLAPPGSLESKDFRYLITGVVHRRGGGGVYSALQVHRSKPEIQRVALKAAFRGGEVDAYGVDATERLRWQQTLLIEFSKYSWCPAASDYFETADGSILIMPWLNVMPWGRYLHSSVNSTSDLGTAILLIPSMLKILCDLHQQDVFLCDVSLDNFLIDLSSHTLHLADLENAWHQSRTWPGFGFTPGYSQPEWSGLDWIDRSQPHFAREQWIARDLYAVGCILHLVLNPQTYSDFVQSCVVSSNPTTFDVWWDALKVTTRPEFASLEKLGARLRSTDNGLDANQALTLITETLTTSGYPEGLLL